MKKPEKNGGLHQRNAVLSKRVGQMLAGSLLAFVSFGASASESDDRKALNLICENIDWYQEEKFGYMKPLECNADFCLTS